MQVRHVERSARDREGKWPGEVEEELLCLTEEEGAPEDIAKPHIKSLRTQRFDKQRKSQKVQYENVFVFFSPQKVTPNIKGFLLRDFSRKGRAYVWVRCFLYKKCHRFIYKRVNL